MRFNHIPDPLHHTVECMIGIVFVGPPNAWHYSQLRRHADVKPLPSFFVLVSEASGKL